MAKDATQARLVIGDLSGGRNGADPAFLLPDSQCVEAFNVDWTHASVAHKRLGATNFPIQAPVGLPPFTGHISFLGRHVPNVPVDAYHPTVDERNAELWAADDAATPVIGVRQAVPGGAFGFIAPTISDPVTGKGWQIQGVTLRGRYYLAYQSGVNRLHVASSGSTAIVRCGLKAPAGVPTMADTGTGSYPATARAYRVRAITQASGVTTRRSEPGPSSAGFTPSGTGSGVLITYPTTGAPGEGETHYELEVSPDGINFYVLHTDPIGTGSYTDTTAWTDYHLLPVSPATGTYGLQRSYRFLAVDNNRLIGFGCFDQTDLQTRLEFSAVIGSSNVSDAERVPLNNYIDLDDADGGEPTGLIGPVFGAVYAFKYHQVWKLTPTGDVNAPYSIYPVSKVVGAVSQRSIVLAEDLNGNPVVYFLSTRGPYRLGVSGLQFLGWPIDDLVRGPATGVNFDATNVVAHALWYAEKGQVWFYVATGTYNDPNEKWMFDVRRSAWARHRGASTTARCSLMYARAPATAGSKGSYDRKPYIGQWDDSVLVGPPPGPQIWRCDDENAGGTDVGFLFQGYVLTKPYPLGGLGAYCTVGQGTLVAVASSGSQVSLSITRDFGLETRSSLASLTPVASEARIQHLFDAAGMGGAWVVQFWIGDTGAVGDVWTIDAVTVNYTKDEALI